MLSVAYGLLFVCFDGRSVTPCVYQNLKSMKPIYLRCTLVLVQPDTEYERHMHQTIQSRNLARHIPDKTYLMLHTIICCIPTVFFCLVLVRASADIAVVMSDVARLSQTARMMALFHENQRENSPFLSSGKRDANGFKHSPDQTDFRAHIGGYPWFAGEVAQSPRAAFPKVCAMVGYCQQGERGHGHVDQYESTYILLCCSSQISTICTANRPRITSDPTSKLPVRNFRRQCTTGTLQPGCNRRWSR